VTPVPRATDVPAAADVVALFQRALREIDTARADGVLGMLLDLHHNNLEQWRCEDTTRSVDASDATVAAAKRAIDGYNATRHVLVEAIDAAVVRTMEQDQSATPATESPAMVFDRLSVLTIRLHATEAEASGGHFGARLPILRDQLTTLQRALDGLFADIRAGHKRFVPYRSLKLYGAGPAPGASTADTRLD
jgi:Protein of unknown function (DUF4254)